MKHKWRLKRFIFVLCLLLLTASYEKVTTFIKDVVENTESRNDFDYKVRVIRISDGDTFVGRTKDNREIRFRLYGIDAPETRQAFANKSTQKLSELIYQTNVEIIEKTKSDKYGRPVVIVRNKDGVIVNEELLGLGLAWHYKYFDSTDKYAQLERNAKVKKLGLWQDKNPIAPWDYRRYKKKNSKTK